MNHSDTPCALVCTGTAQYDTAMDLSALELEERLELSSIAADLFKCLQDIPGSSN